MKLNYKVLIEGTPKPAYQTDGAAGIDFCAMVVDGQEGAHVFDLEGGQRVHTGLSFSIPKDYVGLIAPRSSLWRKGLALKNMLGVIDSDYRGEVILETQCNSAMQVPAGSRIAQMVIVYSPQFELCEVEELDETVRGVGGFGSTGINVTGNRGQINIASGNIYK